MRATTNVVPAKAGTHSHRRSCSAKVGQQRPHIKRHVVWVPAFAGTTFSTNHRDRFCSNKFSAVLANICMLPSRSALPVSSVNTDSAGPATAMQL
jgi:hypothetical protein